MNNGYMINNFQEDWSPWQINTLKDTSNYFIDAFKLTDKDFKICLSHEETESSIRIFFDNNFSSFRFADKTNRHKIYSNLSAKYGKEFTKNNIFFKVENSNYLKWLSSQSNEIPNNDLKHFVILTSDSLGSDVIIDIITSSEPTIKILTEDAPLF